MSSRATWKLQKDDSTVDEFTDVRRKVGNQVIRAYLLDTIVESNRIERVPGKLRGPKNEFKDFAKFLILQLSIDGSPASFLAETGVYENLRIVAVDSIMLAERDSEELIRIFTDALENPEPYNTKLVLSDDSNVR
ncbi:MAG: hypothetical protein ACW96M_08305 [Candidatus Thorarchaeota archaeon]|jgi:hypothetical protein